MIKLILIKRLFLRVINLFENKFLKTWEFFNTDVKIDLEGPEEVTSENEISDSSIAGLNSNESNFNLNISLKQINNYKIKLIFSNQVYALFVVKNQVDLIMD